MMYVLSHVAKTQQSVTCVVKFLQRFRVRQFVSIVYGLFIILTCAQYNNSVLERATLFHAYLQIVKYPVKDTPSNEKPLFDRGHATFGV